jgi:alanine racemase
VRSRTSAGVAKAQRQARAVKPTERDVEVLLTGLASHLAEAEREGLRDMLAEVVERFELDPKTLTCRVHYRISSGKLMASPRGFEPRLPP